MERQFHSYLGDKLRDPDDFEDLGELGHGGLGRVVRCLDKQTGELVAVKKLIKQAKVDQTRNDVLLVREILIPASLRLPSVVRVCGWVPAHDEWAGWIVQEYVPNGSMDRSVKAWRDKEPPAGFGATQISKALFAVAATMARMHEANYLHRDLKLENIMLDGNYEAKIADFGLARRERDVHTCGHGTLSHMAPEMLSGSEYGKGVDVFAFGTLIYSIFTDNDSVVANDHGFQFKVPPGQQFIFVSRLLAGYRLARTDNIPDVWWNLIRQTWSASPVERGHFEDIVQLFLTNDELVIPGTDIEEYRRYCRDFVDTLNRTAKLRREASVMEANRPQFSATGVPYTRPYNFREQPADPMAHYSP